MYPYQKRVLDVFRQAGPEGTSPEAIAQQLRTTVKTVRTAMWSLRQSGFRIVRREVWVLSRDAGDDVT